MKSSIFSIIVAVFFSSSCITIKDSVVDENRFLENKKNTESIYEKKGDGTFINPFNINTNNWGVGNIERLMLVEFEPIENYNCIELQVIENNGNTGSLVILYYSNNKQADVYHTSNLQLNEDSYKNILNNAKVIPAEIQYRFVEVDRKLKANLEFIDRFGNVIRMGIDEKLGEMQPCGLLAPIGGEAESPEFMTLVFMKHFKFLSQKEKNIDVTINGTKAKLVKLPLKINGIKGYQTKYTMEPITVSWNVEANEELEILFPSGNFFKGANYEIEILKNSGYSEIASFFGFQNDHVVRFKFSPSIPDLQCLADNIDVVGKFSMSIDETEGIMAGKYKVEKSTGKTILTVQPTKGYSPVPGKAWMKKMLWHAEITYTNNEFFINTKWIKK